MKHINSFSDYNSLNESISTVYNDRDKIPVITDIEGAIKLFTDGVDEFRYLDFLFAINREKLTMGILKLTPKGKYSGYKVVQNYRYGKIERITEVITQFIQKEIDFANRKEEEKTKKQQLRKDIVNPFKLGDLLYSSWGYEQTNVDFYQVTKVGDKSVWVRPIASEMVEGTAGHDSSNVRPIKDDFRGEEVYKPLVVSTYSDKPCLGGRYPLRPYTSGDKGVYSSWGY
jgi:hypothetical protein